MPTVGAVAVEVVPWVEEVVAVRVPEVGEEAARSTQWLFAHMSETEAAGSSDKQCLARQDTRPHMMRTCWGQRL